MTRTLATLLSSALLVGAVALCLKATPAQAQIVIAPSSACIATISPVYYEGRASYWCGGQWYYQNGGAWGVYGSEPGYLHNYRGSHPAVRQSYGRGRAFGGGARSFGGGGGHAGGAHR
jgi:hypothetical protein